MYTPRSLKAESPHRALYQNTNQYCHRTLLKPSFSDCGDFEARELSFGLRGGIKITACWLDGIVSGNEVTEGIIRPFTDLLRSAGVQTEQDCISQVMSGAVYSHSAKRRDTLDDVVGRSHAWLLRAYIRRRGAGGMLRGQDWQYTRCIRADSRKIHQGRERLFCRNSAYQYRARPEADMLAEAQSHREQHRPQIAHKACNYVRRRRRLARYRPRACLPARRARCRRAPCNRYARRIYSRRAALSFPQLLHTERPDRFSMYLMDGRAGILIDGLPIGLVLPVTLAEFMKSDGRCEQQPSRRNSAHRAEVLCALSQYFSPGALCRDRDVPPGDDPDAAAAVDH